MHFNRCQSHPGVFLAVFPEIQEFCQIWMSVCTGVTAKSE
jgi:hypothetical protein